MEAIRNMPKVAVCRGLAIATDVLTFVLAICMWAALGDASVFPNGWQFMIVWFSLLSLGLGGALVYLLWIPERMTKVLLYATLGALTVQANVLIALAGFFSSGNVDSFKATTAFCIILLLDLLVVIGYLIVMRNDFEGEPSRASRRQNMAAEKEMHMKYVSPAKSANIQKEDPNQVPSSYVDQVEVAVSNHQSQP